jgi:hypothetical protein
MEIYRIDPMELRTVQWPMPVRIFSIGAGYAAICLFVTWYWPSGSGRENLAETIISVIIQAIIFATVVTIIDRATLKDYEITVSDSEMSTRATVFRRSVHRGQIRTILEKRRGLVVSERGKVGTFLWGGVWVPKQLREYDSVRNLALLWRKRGSVSS